MKAIKYAGQILSAIIYSWLLSVVLYLCNIYPWIWGYELSGWKQVVYVFVILGVLLTIAALIYSFALLPYQWIAKKNIVATILSILILVSCSVFTLIRFWRAWLLYFDSWLLPVIVTGGLIWLVAFGCIMIANLYRDQD